MNRMNQTDEVLRFFVDRFSGMIGSTFLVKLAYMADYEAHRHLGRPISGLEWAVNNHGPFDKGFYDSVDRLESAGRIEKVNVNFGFEKPGQEYRSKTALPYDFSGAELAVLDYVARSFSGRNLHHILEVVYETEPFVAVKPRGKGTIVPLEMVNGEAAAAASGITLESVIEGEEAIATGDWISLDDWKRDLQSQS